MTADGKLVLIRQERIPIRTDIWEVPGGQIDEAGEIDSAAIEVRRAAPNCARKPATSSRRMAN